MARNKTREEKIRSAYRLENFRIEATKRSEAKDTEAFSYLDAKFVVRDLTKTIVVSLIMLALIVAAKRFLG